MPEGYRQVIEECATEARKQAAADMADVIGDYHQKLIDAGMTEIVLEDEVITELKEKSQDVYEMVKSELGEELYNSLVDAIEEAKK